VTIDTLILAVHHRGGRATNSDDSLNIYMQPSPTGANTDERQHLDLRLSGNSAALFVCCEKDTLKICLL
jgi:hypothetical protein